MSAFLGPIHYWMYGKIQAQEELIRCLAAKAAEENWAADLEEYLNFEDRSLDAIIDGDNIEKTQHPLIMKAKEHFYSFDEITNVINEVQTQNNTTKNTQWLRAQFFKYVEGYKPKQ